MTFLVNPYQFGIAAGSPEPGDPSLTDFGSHAYWRVRTVTSQGGGQTALSAILFKDDTGSSIATTGGTAFGSGHASVFVEANCFDSVDLTFWESSTNGPGCYVGYQFASPQKVMQVALQRAASMDGSNPPVAARIECSDDGLIWFSCAGIHLGVGTLVNNTPTWFDLSKALI